MISASKFSAGAEDRHGSGHYAGRAATPRLVSGVSSLLDLASASALAFSQFIRVQTILARKPVLTLTGVA